jgi:hypothetical protein
VYLINVERMMEKENHLLVKNNNSFRQEPSIELGAGGSCL